MDSLPFQYQKKRQYWEFYCPVCKAQRRSFWWPTPRPKHYASLAVFIAALVGGLWPWMEAKGLVLGIPAWAVFEFYYRARARQSLVCPHCGFDPYLYKFDVKLARQKIEQHFADKAEREKQAKEEPTEPTKKE